MKVARALAILSTVLLITSVMLKHLGVGEPKPPPSVQLLTDIMMKQAASSCEVVITFEWTNFQEGAWAEAIRGHLRAANFELHEQKALHGTQDTTYWTMRATWKGKPTQRQLERLLTRIEQNRQEHGVISWQTQAAVKP